MARPVDPDPVDALAAAVRKLAPLRGIAVDGDGNVAKTQAPPRIVLYPEDGDCAARAKAPAYFDVDVNVVAAIWGESRAHCWDLLKRLSQAIRIHGSAGGPLVEARRLSWYTGDDDGTQGAPLTYRFTLRAQPVGPPDPELGVVDTVSLVEAP